MSREIKKIQVFLVTKNERGNNEYLELRDFIGGINQKLQRSYHLKIDLVTIEDPNVPPWKHEEYRKQICESEAVFFLVYISMEEFIKLDFDAAFERYKETGKPVIYTYFYKTEDQNRKEDTLAFMKKLDNEIGHFYSFYEHIDTIKLKLLMFLKLGDLDMAEMSFEKGKFIMDGSEVMPLDNVKMVADNTSLKYWHNELEKTEKEYFRLKAIYSKDKSDGELCRKYADIAAKRNGILKEIEDTEKILFEKSLDLVKDSAKGEMTVRQREAYRLLEEGNLEGANAVLDFEEMNDDYYREKEILKRSIKRRASIYINELKSKIDILKIMTEYKNRFNDIVKCYEVIMAESFDVGARYDVVREYADFLDECGYSTKAYEIIKRLENIYGREDVDECDKATFYNTAGFTTYHISGMHEEAEEYYTKAIKIMRRLAEKDPNRYEAYLARSYNNVAIFYDDRGQSKKAEEYYTRAIKIMKRLAEEDPGIYKPDLSAIYDSASGFYNEQGQSKKAEKYCTKAIEIIERLTEENPDRYELDLAKSYNNAGTLYYVLRQNKKAEKYYTKAIDIYERLAKKDTDRYELDLATSYSNAGLFYNYQRQSKKAEKYYTKAIDIYERLAKKDPDRYEPDLAKSYNNAGLFYNYQRQGKKAEEYYIKAIEIGERLVKKAPNRYEPDLAKSYNNAGIFYKNQRQGKKAEKYYTKAIEISERLVEKDPDQYEPDLAISHFNYGMFTNDEKYFEKALLIAKKNPQDPYCRRILNRLENSVFSTIYS